MSTSTVITDYVAGDRLHQPAKALRYHNYPVVDCRVGIVLNAYSITGYWSAVNQTISATLIFFSHSNM